MNIEQEAKSISVGKHVVELINVSEGKKSKRGLRCIVFKWLVITGSDEGCFISDRFYMGTNLYFLAKMIESLGRKGEFKEDGSIEYYFNKLAGKRTTIKVEEESYNGNSSMKVKEYKPLDKKMKEEVEDIDRIAPEDYEAPAEIEENENTGGSLDVGDDDIPF